MTKPQFEWDRAGSTVGMDPASAARYQNLGYDPATAAMMHANATTLDAIHGAARRPLASAHIDYAGDAHGTGSGPAFLGGAAKLIGLLLLLAGIVGYLPVDRAMQAGALALSGVGEYALSAPAFYEAEMPVELSRSLEENLAEARPAIDLFVEPVHGKNPTPASVDAFLAATIQGYRFEPRNFDEAERAGNAVYRALAGIHKKTGSDVPLHDLGYLLVATGGDYLSYPKLHDRHQWAASAFPDSAVVEDRLATMGGIQYKAAIVLQGLGEISSRLGVLIRQGVQAGIARFVEWWEGE